MDSEEEIGVIPSILVPALNDTCLEGPLLLFRETSMLSVLGFLSDLLIVQNLYKMVCYEFVAVTSMYGVYPWFSFYSKYACYIILITCFFPPLFF